MKCIGIIAKPSDPRVKSVVSGLAQWLEERDRNVFFDQETADVLGRTDGILRSRLSEKCDFLIVLGGDGTLLSAARTVGYTGKPILGVNMGGLGFMTAVTLDELFPALTRILRDEIEYDERMMLDVHLHRHGEQVADYTVLNEVVINKGALARIIDIRVYVEQELLADYKADGLIISSPTGSTGYSLSAHGPIVHPSLQSILVTPICPHMLTLRPLLIPDDMVVRAELVLKGTEVTDVFLTLDGQVGFRLQKGDVIEVRKAKSVIKFIRSPFRDYFTMLRTKLKWGER